MSVAALVPRVREALGVSSSFDDEIIPALLRRCILRLLRDYHFPKSVVRTEFAAPHDDEQSFTLPVGFKKELQVQLYDSATTSWGDPLRKTTGFRRPSTDSIPRHYWLEGTQLWIDTPLSGGRELFTLQLFAESVSVADHEAWFTVDFEDVLFTYATLRGAAEQRKPEVMQIYTPLWADERGSLAIYLNELEFGGLEMMQREAKRPNLDSRYPR